MNVYSDTYIPLWLEDVNTAIGTTRSSVEIEPLELQRQRYIQSFSGSDVWQWSPKPASTATATEPSQLTEHIGLIKDFVHQEWSAKLIKAKSWDRFNVKIEPFEAAWSRSGFADRSHVQISRLYQCTVPGVQEFMPAANIGDVRRSPRSVTRLTLKVVELRQLVPEYRTFDSNVYTTVVHAVRRAKNIIILKAPVISLHSGHFNLKFFIKYDKTQGQLTSLRQAIDNDNERAWLASYLNPNRASGRLKTQLTQLKHFDWQDSMLNTEQKRAVQDIIENRYGDMPYLIQGPPGTGKTKIVVEAVLQVLRTNKDARIIVCGPSNTSADVVALRLIRALGDPTVLCRLNGPSRSFEEVPESLLPFCCIEGDRFVLPQFLKLMKFKIIVGTIEEVSELNHVKCNNISLFHLRQFMSQAFHETELQEIKPHFTHLFLDEAGQATEIESICALQILQPPIASQNVNIIFAGDHQQLGPFVDSEQNRSLGRDISLFEKLLGSPCYAEHPLSRKNIMKNARPSLPYPFPPFANLFRNYRSHETILMAPSQLFYDASLAACATNVESIAGVINENIPVIFVPHSEEEDTANIEQVTSWYNATEIRAVVKEVRNLVSLQDRVPIKASDIAVLTPYREQVIRLRSALRAIDLYGVGVGTVEDYQGAESRIVILSIVRTRASLLERDLLSGIGLIKQPRRMNVALTRAKELLIVVANPRLLELDLPWQAWLAFCRRHGTYRGEQALSESTEGGFLPISALEAAYHFHESGMPSLGSLAAQRQPNLYTDDAMILTGHLAQVVLDEIDY